MLHDISTAPRAIAGAVTTRLKVMADMNIAEHRLPQDGRISLTVGNRPIDLRMATLPTIYGEKVVMRVLDKSNVVLGFEDLGFDADLLDRYQRIFTKPYGTILVTGPTGCGKTTTLYATLAALNHPEKNIITVEDPVELRIKGINQVQLNLKAGLNFASALRSILRSDPDIVLVGEIRDRETAMISVEAALTGHLVLATLHTNDSASTPMRLVEMGVEPYLVTSAISGALAQRLTRRLCVHCREPFDATEADIVAAGWSPAEVFDDSDKATLYRAVGCSACSKTGYRGRKALLELLSVTEDVERMIIEGGTADDIHKLAVEQGMVTLRQSGLRKALEGETTLEEVIPGRGMSAGTPAWSGRDRLAQSIVTDGYAEEGRGCARARRGLPAQRDVVPGPSHLAQRRLAGGGAGPAVADGPAARGGPQPRPPERRGPVPDAGVRVARQYGAVGYRLDGDQLTMAFGDPPDEDDVRSLSVLVGHPVVPVLGDPIAIDRLLASARRLRLPPPPPPAAGSSNGAAGSFAAAAAVPANGNGAHVPVGAALPPVADDGEEMPLHLDDLLRYAVSVGASDLHLTTGLPACIRLHGAVRPIEGCPVLDHETIRDMVFGILPQTLRERFEAEKELDTSHSIADVGRFRLNVFQQRGTVAAALRSIPHEIPAFEVLGIPEAVRSFTEMRRGLVLVTGPTGRKVHHPGLARRHHQQDQAAAHHHGGGPHRVPPRTTRRRW